MNIFVLGGTGSIGAAVVEVLIERGHTVTGLCRSETAERSVQRAGANTIRGDFEKPNEWIAEISAFDGIVQAAAVWGPKMDFYDAQFVGVLLQSIDDDPQKTAFIYTGGCWMYGNTRDAVVTETSPRKPLPAFAGSISIAEKVLAATNIRGMVVHPGMVYDRNGGVFDHVFADAKALGRVRVVGGESVRWPMVHRIDLAHLYALMLEQGQPGDEYNGIAVNGLTIGEMTRCIARRLGVTEEPEILNVETAKHDFSALADGYALDQQISSQKAFEELGWRPQHLDVLADIG